MFGVAILQTVIRVAMNEHAESGRWIQFVVLIHAGQHAEEATLLMDCMIMRHISANAADEEQGPYSQGEPDRTTNKGIANGGGQPKQQSGMEPKRLNPGHLQTQKQDNHKQPEAERKPQIGPSNDRRSRGGRKWRKEEGGPRTEQRPPCQPPHP